MPVDQMVAIRTLTVTLALSLPSLAVAGCQGTCSNVSRKLVEECDLLWQQDLEAEDLETQCQAQEDLYEDDPDASQAFADQLDCLWRADCDELESDPELCWDGEVYVIF